MLQTQLRHYETHNVDLNLQSWVHNNLAFISWMHLLELPKITDQNLKQQILRDESLCMTFFKRSIELCEKSTNKKINHTKLSQLLQLDIDQNVDASE